MTLLPPPHELTDRDLSEMITLGKEAARLLDEYLRELAAEQTRRHGFNQMSLAY